MKPILRHITDFLMAIPSWLLHPLLIPTYGMGLFFYAFRGLLPIDYVKVYMFATLFLTLFAPLFIIVALIFDKKISNIYMSNARERTIPYIFTIFSYAVWSYLFTRNSFPPLQYIAVTASVLLIAITIINRWWKISAHLTAFGMLAGSIIALSAQMQIVSARQIIILLTIALYLMVSRIYRKAHTPMQTIAGFWVGFVAGYIARFIY